MLLKEPGNLADLGPVARQAWHDDVVGLVTTAISQHGTVHFKLLPEANWPSGTFIVDWDGFPKILENCLGPSDAAALCDWKTPAGDRGRVLAQDEYFEWRTVHDSSGRLIRFEGTTELASYWSILAAHHPTTTLRILGRFAGEQMADAAEVYGTDIDPFSPTTLPEDRRSAFNDMMIYKRNGQPVLSPYNNGQKAIAFLSKPVSSLRAAVQLFVRASVPTGKNVNGNQLPMNGAEAIAASAEAGNHQQAIDCRNSDPTMVGLMNGLVWDGKAVAFNDPVGVYIRSLAHSSILDPQGNPIPEDWVEFQRGSRPQGGQGEEHSQRVIVEVPPGRGFVLGDCISRETGDNFSTGYQLAELVKAVVYFRASQPNVVSGNRSILPLAPLPDCSSAQQCAVEQRWLQEFNASRNAVAPAAGAGASAGSRLDRE